MSVHFHSLRVKEIIKETPRANTIVFEKPEGDTFNYLPGQYLTLKLDVNGESLRRAYSLCSSPTEDADLAVTVKRVEGGKISNWIPDHLQAGDMVEVLPPMGNFHINPAAGNSHHYVLLGGGSGITPLMSILKSVIAQEPGSKVTLLYGNADVENIIFRETLSNMAKSHPDRLRVVHVLDNPGNTFESVPGIMNRQVVLSLVQDVLGADNLPKSYWMCGPAPMMEEVQAALGFLGIPSADVHRESFTAPLPDPDKASAPAAKGTGTYTVTVIIDGNESEVTVDPDTTILEAIIDEGLDPPYACQMGVCCTCRAKVHAGSVEMEEDEGLSDTEIEGGYILTCQSHPLTPDVKIEFM